MSSSGSRVSTSIRTYKTDLWLIDATAGILGYSSRSDALVNGYLAYVQANHSDNPAIKAVLEQYQARFQPAQSKAA